MMDRAIAAVADETPSVLASLGSSLTAAGILSGHIQIPAGLPSWIPIVVTLAGPAITILATRVLASWAAGKRAQARSERAKAARIRADADPTNDTQADTADDRAAELEAEAAALDGLRRRAEPPQ